MANPIGAIAAMDGAAPAENLVGAPKTTGASFAGLLLQGVEQVDQKVIDADALATAFALDDSMPVHQVTYALEQARVSFELMMQVRNRLTEGYQEIMRMQI